MPTVFVAWKIKNIFEAVMERMAVVVAGGTLEWVDRENSGINR